ncbi:MAG: hypothetical protein LBT58_03370 [Endomicrobium sp.]|nr:hypothetical protein [Endomicrobium sp.]
MWEITIWGKRFNGVENWFKVADDYEKADNTQTDWNGLYLRRYRDKTDIRNAV